MGQSGTHSERATHVCGPKNLSQMNVRTSVGTAADPMPDDFACALRDAHGIVSLLHTLADEWSAPRQRKGRPVPAETARTVLCDFEGTPCPLFGSPVGFLAGYAAYTRGRFGRPLQVSVAHSTASPSLQHLLATAINVTGRASVSQHFADPAEADVVLLQAGAPLPQSVERWRVTLVLASSPSRPLSPSQWRAQLPSQLSLISPGAAASVHFFPQTDSDPQTDGAVPGTAGGQRASTSKSSSSTGGGRRGRPSSNPDALHSALMVWRTETCGPLPLYDLRRPPDFATPAEAHSAAAAVESGVGHPEWFTCASLEVLRPVVRNLFRLPRRKGKSVWATCFGREAPRLHSPCFWFSGQHFRGEHFVTQVLSSPDVLLSRMSAHRNAASALLQRSTAAVSSSNTPLGPPPLLLDPAAGEGNYTQHLPDGMGRMPALALVAEHGWHAVLGEPEPETHSWLRRNFEPHMTAGRVTLLTDGVTHEQRPTVTPLHFLDARVPELVSAYPPRGLPDITRQRLQWATSIEIRTALSVRGDLWLFNHLAGGPILEALERSGQAERAAAFRSCKHNSDKRKARCYNATVVRRNVTLRPWSHIIDGLPRKRALPAALPAAAADARAAHSSAIDLLVVNQRDPSVGPLLKAFPYEVIKPSLVYFRTSSGNGVRRHLLAHGYQTSAHWETSAWGEHTLAWRAERCNASFMLPPPLWSLPAFGASAARAASEALQTVASPMTHRGGSAGRSGPSGGRRGRRRGGGQGARSNGRHKLAGA